MSLPTNHRILVIDDNRAIHEDFRKILCPEQSGIDDAEAEFFGGQAPVSLQPVFEVDSAFQGKEGVAAVRRALEDGRPYAMAFVDVRMPPGADGIETAEMLWQLCPDLQIVICTAYSDYSWSEMIARLGNRDRLLVLKKPFAAVEALQLACALCEKWQLTQEARDRLAGTERIVEERTRELREANERLCAEMEQREQTEKQLLRAQRQESIGTLASGIAHDLNNMLSPILLSLNLLKVDVPETSQDLLVTIETCAQRASAMVKQVLTFARGVEGDRLPLELKYVIREIEKIVVGTFPRQIAFQTRLAEDLPAINGDSTQIQQVLLNLCLNARDAMPVGGTLRIEADRFEVDELLAVSNPGMRCGCYVRLRLSDTGTGMPKQMLDKIFDPFFTTKPLGQGTGLGLSTALGIIKSHEGFVDVHSKLGEGSIFSIFLPVADAQPAVVQEEETDSATGRGQLILIVDDEAAVRKTTAAALALQGYRTLTAADGVEALAIYAEQGHSIDAVLTDVMMPIVDGVALSRALKKMNPKVRIIAATGAAEESRKQELKAFQVSQILAKPFTVGVLLAALEEMFSTTNTMDVFDSVLRSESYAA
jgi:hypothetical protein